MALPLAAARVRVARKVNSAVKATIARNVPMDAAKGRRDLVGLNVAISEVYEQKVRIEERSFVAALLWMTAKGGPVAGYGLWRRFALGGGCRGGRTQKAWRINTEDTEKGWRARRLRGSCVTGCAAGRGGDSSLRSE